MQQLLRKLSLAIKEQKSDDAVYFYSELIKNNVSQKDIVFSLLKDMIPILYRNLYYRVPHGIMGISAAIDISDYIDDFKSLPLAQAINYLADENKLAPLNFSAVTPYYTDDSEYFDNMQNYILQGEIPTAYRYFLGLEAKNLTDIDFHTKIFYLAFEDLVNIGHKAIYYHKIQELIKYLDEKPPNIYYPVISYLASEPKDFSIKDIVLKEYYAFRDLNIDLSNNKKDLTDKEALNTIDIIINSMRTTALTHITDYLKEGRSIRSLSDTITIAASQLVLDTEMDDWIMPVHGFNYCYALNSWFRNYTSKDSVLGLFYQAAFLNYLSVELKKVHFTSASVYVKHRCILDNIIKAIRKSNVSDAVSLTQSYMLSDFEDTELIKRLAVMSVINGSLKNFTHDMKFTSSCIKEYEQNKSPIKWLIIVALAKHLAQSPKDYDCFTRFIDYTKESEEDK